MKKLLIASAVILGLSGCSEPQEEASEVAQDLCNSLKREILNFDKFATKDYAWEWYDLYSENKGLYKSTVSMLNCKVESVDVIETEDSAKYRVNFKHGLFMVKEIDGDLKVTGHF